MFLQKRLTQAVFVSMLLLSISACSSSTAPTATPNNDSTTAEKVIYAGKTTAASISPQNQAKIYTIAQGETVQLGTSIAAKRKVTRSSSNLFQQLTSLTSIPHATTKSYLAKGGITLPQNNNNVIQGSTSGTLTWTGEISKSGVGKITAVLENYNNGAGTLNGTIIYDVRASNISTGEFYDMTTSYDVLEFTSTTAHTIQTGSLTFLTTSTSNSYTKKTTANQDFTDLLSGTQYRYKNLSITTTFNASNPAFATQVDLSISGRIYEQSEGYIDIDTNPPFHFNTLTQTNPSSGTIRIQGANGSLLQATAASETRTILALDTNGDGNFESTVAYAWDDEFGTPLPNNPPVISGLTFLPADVYTDTNITLDGYTASDSDLDNLTYTYVWKINGVVEPSATNTTLENGLFSKNDAISCAVSVSDGLATVSSTINTIVLNSQPTGVLQALSSTPTRADTLTAQFSSATDADGDTLIYNYSWKNNGTIISGQTSSNLVLSAFNVNDVITLNATVSDGYSALTFVSSTTIIAQPIVTSYITPAPATTPTNQALSFQVSATQNDGYPIAYSMAYGPDNMMVDAYGNVNWTPNEPMFATALDVNYGIQVQALDLYAQITGTIQITDNLRQQPIVRQGMRLPANGKSMYVVDMNNDAQNEVVMVSTSNYGASSIAQLRFDGTNYVEDWIFPYEINPGNPINSSFVADINNDLKPDIIVTSKNTLAIIDGETREISKLITTSQPYMLSTEVADLDGDGNKEIITLSGVNTSFNTAFTIQVYNASTLALIWESTQANLGSALTIGNVDNDAALEIITSEGFVFDGATQALEWNYGSPFGFTLDTGDLNADGVEEIVGAIDWANIQTYSAVSKTVTGVITPSWLDFSSLVVTNIDTDAYAEIIVGDGQWGNVTVYDGLTLSQQWSISSQDSDASNLMVGDSDNDSQLEIFWVTASGSKLVVAGIDPYVNIEWNSHASSSSDVTTYASPSSQTVIPAPKTGGYLATTALGQSNIIFATPSTYSSNGGTRVISIDPLTGNTLLSSELGSNWSRKESIAVADYDKDGIDEILLGTSKLYDAYFSVYNFASDLVESQSALYLSDASISITHADMNGDGFEDIISLSENSYIYIWDARNQSLIWKSNQIGSQAFDIAVADLNQNGTNEVITLTNNLTTGLRQVDVFENILGTYTKQVSSQELPYATLLTVGDVNKDGVSEIIVGNGSYYLGSFTQAGAQTSNLFVLDGITLTEKYSFTVQGTIFDVLVSNQPSSKPSLILGIKDMNYHNKLLKVDATTGSIIWSVDKLLGTPQLNSIHQADINGDGVSELMIGTSEAMYITR